MPGPRRVRATFSKVTPASDSESVGVDLEFRLLRKSLGLEIVSNYAPLGPEHCVPAVAGLGKVLRVLRAGRIATPSDTTPLLGQVDRVAELLARALGTVVHLELRARSRIRFEAWTEDHIEVVDHVAEVIETPDCYLVLRKGGRFPLRVPRSEVVRQLTETERWYEILSIERA